MDTGFHIQTGENVDRMVSGPLRRTLQDGGERRWTNVCIQNGFVSKLQDKTRRGGAVCTNQ